MKSKFPAIEKACLEVDLDNGGINRFRSEKVARRDIREFIERTPLQEFLPDINRFLLALTGPELRAVCSDPEGRDDLMNRAPPFTDQLLNDFFDR